MVCAWLGLTILTCHTVVKLRMTWVGLKYKVLDNIIYLSLDRYCFNFYRKYFFWKMLPLQNSKWCQYSFHQPEMKAYHLFTHSFFHFWFFWQVLIQILLHLLECSVTSFWADSHIMWFKHTNISETKPISIIRIQVWFNTPDNEVSFWNNVMLEPPEMAIGPEFYQILLLWKLRNM